jgi:asparagine synthase (glutamine-hydrolysing)
LASVTRSVSPREFGLPFENSTFSLGGGSGIRDRQVADLTLYSIPALLHYEDRNSMAHSVEARVPFLDHELVEFIVSCPADVKLRRGWTKWILRESLADVLPEKIRRRKNKMGFPTPFQRWLREGGLAVARNLFGSRGIRMQRFLERAKVLDEFERFCSSGHSKLGAAALFRILSLELWAQVHTVS